MAAHGSLRASDADREAVAERLRQAAVEGRLEPEELEERLHGALRARTYADLRRLVGDLPGKPKGWTEVAPAARIALAVAIWAVLAVAAVAAVLVVAALLAAWWMLCAVVWFALCGRRACAGRLGARRPWDRAPRGVQRRRLAGSR